VDALASRDCRSHRPLSSQVEGRFNRFGVHPKAALKILNQTRPERFKLSLGRDNLPFGVGPRQDVSGPSSWSRHGQFAGVLAHPSARMTMM
jgi:hypothetical protein